MRALKYALLIGLLALASCATPLNVKTPREGIAACYKSVEVVLNTAADHKARGRLSPGAQVSVLNSADQALSACDTARAALTVGNATGVNAGLALAQSILLQLEAILGGAK